MWLDHRNAGEAQSAIPAGNSVPYKTSLVHEILEEQATNIPDAPLLDYFGQIYSYRDIDDEARRVASGLAKLRIRQGDRVGLLLPNVPQYVSAYYGIMMLGAVVVNYSPLSSVDQIARQVEDSGTRLLLTLDSKDLLPLALHALDGTSLEHIVVASVTSRLPLLKSLLYRIFNVRETCEVPERSDLSLFRDLVRNRGGHPRPEIDPCKAAALFQYTGGTTGTPKAAVLTHSNLVQNARQVLQVDPAKGDIDRVMGALPLFHIFGQTIILNRTIANGGTVILLPRFNAGDVIDAMGRASPSALPGVPAMFEKLLKHRRIRRVDWSGVRTCVVGGAPLSERLAARFYRETGITLTQGYGLTESAGVVAANQAGTHVPSTCVGKPLEGTTVRIAEPGCPEQAVEGGAPGEILVAGPQIMWGYLHAGEENPFFERFLKTGDIGRIDVKGRLHVLDRLKDILLVGGANVYPSQLEEKIRNHPDIVDCAVVGAAHPVLGQAPWALVVQRRGKPLSVFQAMHWINARVGKHERLHGIVFVRSIPRTSLGKPDRNRLTRILAKRKIEK